MTRSVRRALLLLAGLLFAAIAPGVILYAIGYRPTWPGSDQSSVGVLMVDGLPKKAVVEINGQPVGRLPQMVANMPVGTVDVRLSKDGYIPWQKTLIIEPKRATAVQAARLWPQSAPVLRLKNDIKDFSLSPNRSLMAITYSNQTWQIIDNAGRAVSPLIKLRAAPVEVTWSPDNAFVVLSVKNGQFFLYDVAQAQDSLVSLPALTGAKQISWDLRVPGRLVVHTKLGSLIAFNVVTGSSTPLVDDIKNYAISSRNIVAVTSDGRLEMFNLQGQLTGTLSTALEQEPALILMTPAGNIALLLPDGRLVMIGPNGSLIPVAEQALAAAWSPDGRILLIQSNHNELQVYNVDNQELRHIPLNQLQLVVRLSQSIINPQWYAGGQHIIYQVNDEIIITEIDTRDHPISYSVDTTNNGRAAVAVGEDGNEIYYLKNVDNRTGLWRASLFAEDDRVR